MLNQACNLPQRQNCCTSDASVQMDTTMLNQACYLPQLQNSCTTQGLHPGCVRQSVLGCDTQAGVTIIDREDQSKHQGSGSGNMEPFKCGSNKARY